MSGILTSIKQLFETQEDDLEAEFIYFWDDVGEDELVEDIRKPLSEIVKENSFFLVTSLLLITVVASILLAFFTSNIVLVISLVFITIGIILISFFIVRQWYIKPFEILKENINLINSKDFQGTDELLYSKGQLESLDKFDEFRNDISKLLRNFKVNSLDISSNIENLQNQISIVLHNVDLLNNKIHSSTASESLYQQTKSHLTSISTAIDHFTENFDMALNGIEEISSIINSIGKQTTMLALNAGIEAARAGEEGRGFEVVASNLRRLAQHAIDSSSRIRNMSKEINQNAKIALEGITSSMSDLHRGIDRNFEQITVLSSDLDGSVLDINNIRSDIGTTFDSIQKNISLLEEYTY